MRPSPRWKNSLFSRLTALKDLAVEELGKQIDQFGSATDETPPSGSSRGRENRLASVIKTETVHLPLPSVKEAGGGPLVVVGCVR